MNLIGKTGLLFALYAGTTQSGADELGRLFFTPEQRAQLEYSRQQENDSAGSGHVLTVNGIVQKDGGNRTVWINGVPQAAGKSDGRVPESQPVTLPGQTQPIKVKVGQKVLIKPAGHPAEQ